MIRGLGDKKPRIHPSAWISEDAYLVGDIVIGENCSVWPGVTIRADGESPVTLGNNVNVQEGSVIHGNGLVIEDNVTIGHAVVVHGDFIGAGTLLGNNWKILGNSYLINGEISVTRKSEYDYLWTCDSNSNSGENTGNKGPYDERINFLNNQ